VETEPRKKKRRGYLAHLDGKPLVLSHDAPGPSMVEAKHGSIVVVGSRAVERPWTSTGAAAYAAVVTLAQTVAQEVLEHGVRINSILPSTMDTPANRSAMPSAGPTKWVSLDSASQVIALLLSEDSRDVSGAALSVYGRA
jgi:NAD(P)-dependent dehydrogenase (short-subunit alcohol dehydrogenase family)